MKRNPRNKKVAGSATKQRGRPRPGNKNLPRLLLLSESLPVKQMDGGNIRVGQILRSLSRQYRVSLVAFTRDKREVAQRSALNDYCEHVWVFHLSNWRIAWNCLWGFFSSVPLNVCSYRHPGLKRLLRGLVEEDYQLIYVYRLRLAHYLAGWHGKKIIDLTDCLTEYYRQRANLASWLVSPYWWVEYWKMRRYEPGMASRFSLGLVVTTLEKARLNVDNVRALPNGVDLKYFSPGPERERRGLIFMGTMSYAPNIDAVKYFLKEILPTIRQELPGLPLTVVGRYPGRLGKSCRVAGVKFTGEVRDVRPYLRRGKVLINPLRMGVGLQNKLLQAMACGLPVVTSPFSARGLGAVGGHQLLIGRDGEEFARQVIKIHKMPSLASRLAKSGRRFVEVEYAWPRQFKKLEQMIAGI
jgi:sugar transferase (PEP-CTERM/EpsH1 system associated)